MSKFKCPGHKRGDVPHDWGKMMLIHEGGPTWTKEQFEGTSGDDHGHSEMVMGSCTEVVLMNF
jgi:hypothetical protein